MGRRLGIGFGKNPVPPSDSFRLAVAPRLGEMGRFLFPRLIVTRPEGIHAKCLRFSLT